MRHLVMFYINKRKKSLIAFCPNILFPPLDLSYPSLPALPSMTAFLLLVLSVILFPLCALLYSFAKYVAFMISSSALTRICFNFKRDLVIPLSGVQLLETEIKINVSSEE